MDPDDHSRKEPFLAPLYRGMAALAPVLLVLGVLLGWMLATDGSPLGQRLREVRLGGETPSPSPAPGGGKQDAGGATLAPTSERLGAATQPAITTAPTEPSAIAEAPVATAAPIAATPSAAAGPPALPTAAGPTVTAGPTTPSPTAMAASTATAGPTATTASAATPGPSATAAPTDSAGATATPTATAPPTRTPTSRPIEEGWTAYGGEWDWQETGVVEGTSEEGDALWLYDESYGDFTYTVEVQAFDREAGMAFRMQDEDNGFIYTLVPQGATEGTPGLYLNKRVDGTDNMLASTESEDLPWTEDWATLSVEVTGDSLRLYLNGDLEIEYDDSEHPSFLYGRLGLRIYGDSDEPCSATFRSISLP
jgi:hypothetical protein